MNMEPEKVARAVIDHYGLDTGNAETYVSDGVLHVVVVGFLGATATATLPTTSNRVLIEAALLYALTVATQDENIHPQDRAFFAVGVRRLRGDVPSPASAAMALLTNPQAIDHMALALHRYADGTREADPWSGMARAALKALVPVTRRPHAGPVAGMWAGTHEPGASKQS